MELFPVSVFVPPVWGRVDVCLHLPQEKSYSKNVYWKSTSHWLPQGKGLQSVRRRWAEILIQDIFGLCYLYLSGCPELWPPFGVLPVELRCLGLYNPTAICHQVWLISGVAVTLQEMILGHQNQARRLAKEDLLVTAFLVAGTSPFLEFHSGHNAHTCTTKPIPLKHGSRDFNVRVWLWASTYHNCPFDIGPCPTELIEWATWWNENQREVIQSELS